MEMSRYAADTIRVVDIERVKHKDYQPVKVNPQKIKPLLDEQRIKAKAIASWRRGGLHVTAVELANHSKETLAVDYQRVKGQWLASSVENSVLAAKGQAEDRTYLYLISPLSIEETMTGVH